MSVSFPSVNPYLEHPDIWPEVHQRLIKTLARLISDKLPEQYEIAIRKRIYRVSGDTALIVGQPNLGQSGLGQPDHRQTELSNPSVSKVQDYQRNGTSAAGERQNGVLNSVAQSTITLATAPPSISKPTPVYVPVPQEVREDYLEIVEPDVGEVITTIEILTPQKKRAGRGREMYEQHRESLLGSPVHFVEIDLLRGWNPLVIYGPDEESDYRILVSRSEQRPQANLYTWNVNEPIPSVPLPLHHPHETLVTNLKQALDLAYEHAGYNQDIDYQREPLPPLRTQETDWLAMFLQQQGIR
ncbi:MAG: DUF4058 family protein [Cyanobacteria bacterium P01_D01_bin.44]